MLGKNLYRLVKKMVLMNLQVVREYKERQRFFADPTLSKSTWEGLPDTLFQEHEPIFVLSTGRCGTELLTSIFSAFPETCCYHAPSPELLNAEKMAYMEGADKFNCYLTAIRTARLELVMDCMFRGRRYIETNYRCTFFAPHVSKLFPKAKFIHLLRDPIAFIESGVRLGFYTTGLYTDIGRITPYKGGYKARWDEMDQYMKMAWLWNETNQYIENFKDVVDPSRVMTVRSEDLFSDVETTSGILRFCNLPDLNGKTIEKIIRIPQNTKNARQAYEAYKDWSLHRQDEVREIALLASLYGYEF